MRLSYELIDEIVEKKCCKSDVKFLLYCLSIRQEDGWAYNVESTVLCNKLHINQPTYSKRIKSLEEKGLIFQKRTKKGFRHIYVNCSRDYKKGYYVNINRDLFGKELFNLRRTEIYTILKLMKRNRDILNDLKCKDEVIANYANISPQNKKTIKRIISSIGMFYANGKKMFDVYSYKKSVYNVHVFKLLDNDKRKDVYELEVRQRHTFTSFCRRNKVDYTSKDIDDLISIENRNPSYGNIVKFAIKEIALQYHKLECALINHKIKERLKTASLYRQPITGFIPLI